jgi:folate-dependent phosphoribosylglycinamide formyltransferase PurN
MRDDELPDAGVIMVSATDFQKILDAIENPKPPAPALVAIMQNISRRVAEAIQEAGLTWRWLDQPCPALDPKYAGCTTPRQVLDAGDEDLVLALLDEIKSGVFSL